VWLALAVEAHAHHDRAKSYWKTEAAPVSAFCRVTQLAFLRYLTNRAIMNTGPFFRPFRDFRASRTLNPAVNCRAILFCPAGWETAIALKAQRPARIHEGVKRDRGAAFMPLQRRHRTAARRFHGFLLL
jgi:hypothetical protein